MRESLGKIKNSQKKFQKEFKEFINRDSGFLSSQIYRIFILLKRKIFS